MHKYHLNEYCSSDSTFFLTVHINFKECITNTLHEN